MIKVRQKDQEYFVSVVYLILRMCFSLLAIISLMKLGYSAKIRLTRLKEIRAMKHEGFWQCMDHKLDKDLLDLMVKQNKAPWIK